VEELLFLGTGNAFSESGDRPSCYLLNHNENKILIDCGPAILPALYENQITPKQIDMIYISHLHPDHYMGLAFIYLENYYVSKREKSVPVLCPSGLPEKITSIINLIYEPYEAARIIDCFNFVELTDNDQYSYKDLQIRTFPSDHDAKARMAVFTSPTYSLGYSSDTNFVPEQLDTLIAHADLIIHEATSADLYIEGHTNLYELLEFEFPDDKIFFLTNHDQSVLDALQTMNLPRNLILVRDNDHYIIEDLLKLSKIKH